MRVSTTERLVAAQSIGETVLGMPAQVVRAANCVGFPTPLVRKIATEPNFPMRLCSYQRSLECGT